MLRTHTCGELNKKQVQEITTICGWVHRRRDHGGIIFIDLRDRYGLTQIKFDPEINKEAHAKADQLRNEWVVSVTGKVIGRPEEMINKKLITGEIEIEVSELEILSKSETPPFELEEEKKQKVNENLRLKYRFIDLRRPKLQKMLQTRDQLIRHMRAYFHKNDFLEVQTPILTSSSPEGARDFLVPSRSYPGKFYALPQAPQQFKQLLMVGGVDKYFQIAPCFRDEDCRMDRHFGEFYQLDMEMSFVTQEDIFAIQEPLMIELTEKFSNKEVMQNPFPRITWKDAMNKYGTDKPDLRFEMEIKPVTELVQGCDFKVFADMASKDGHAVHALRVPGGAKFSRKEIDELTGLAQEKEAKGLAYITLSSPCEGEGAGVRYEIKSPIVKFLGEDLTNKIIKEVEAQAGDIIFFGADKWRIVCDSLGAVRDDCGRRLNLKDNNKAAWCWIVDFPMYDYSELEHGRIDFSHNPFSMPQGGMKALEEQDPLDILAYQYDFVLNGFEITSGAIRNHKPEIMYKAFEIAGYTSDDVDKKFGHMIRAFKYGAPPHGGNAPGIDRLLMVLNDWDSIRDIYAFPKDGQGRDVMMDAPGDVDEQQLKDLKIKIIEDL